MTAADRMRRMRERRKAEGLKPVVSRVPRVPCRRVVAIHRIAFSKPAAWPCIR